MGRTFVSASRILWWFKQLVLMYGGGVEGFFLQKERGILLSQSTITFLRTSYK